MMAQWVINTAIGISMAGIISFLLLLGYSFLRLAGLLPDL
jgi:hypothetical protein